MDESIEFLKELTEANGISGYEEEIRKIIRKHLSKVCEIEQDKLGSIICKKSGVSPTPKIMLPGHMDEIGFLVRSITDKGFIKFGSIGGWFDQVLLSQRVIIKGKKGDCFGIVASKPPHILTDEERKRTVERKDMFIDIGARSKKEALEEFGVRPGDPIIPFSPFHQLGNSHLLAKAWDDRIGCALFIDVIKRLQKIGHPNTVYGVGTVQEEVGLRGARTSVSVIEPDLAIICEVGIANDVLEVKSEDIIGKLGDGPQICVYDSGMIPNLKLRDLVIETAKKNNIPYQFEYLERGATDGAQIHVYAKGVPSVSIGVPARYIHTHAGIININDYENTVKLIVELIKILDNKTTQSLTK